VPEWYDPVPPPQHPWEVEYPPVDPEWSEPEWEEWPAPVAQPVHHAAPSAEVEPLPRQAFGGHLQVSTMVHRVHDPSQPVPGRHTGGDPHRYAGAQPAEEVVQPEPAALPRADAAQLGTVTVFFAGHGGSGCTTLACNMASTLARAGRSACIVDMDLQLGDSLGMLDLSPMCPMSRLAREMESFDWEMLETMLARHRSGVHVVSQVGCLEELNELTPQQFPALIQRLQQRFDHVIVDGLRDFSDNALAVLDLAKQIILVASQDVPAVRGVARRLHIFRRLGYTTDRIQVVINRYAKDNPVSSSAITESIGAAPAFLVPDDVENVQRAVGAGSTLHQVAPRAPACQEVDRMSQVLFDLPSPARRPSLLSRLFRKSKKEKGNGADKGNGAAPVERKRNGRESRRRESEERKEGRRRRSRARHERVEDRAERRRPKVKRGGDQQPHQIEENRPERRQSKPSRRSRRQG
jgi:pilus assembly protein CpaE